MRSGKKTPHRGNKRRRRVLEGFLCGRPTKRHRLPSRLFDRCDESSGEAGKGFSTLSGFRLCPRRPDSRPSPYPLPEGEGTQFSALPFSEGRGDAIFSRAPKGEGTQFSAVPWRERRCIFQPSREGRGDGVFSPIWVSRYAACRLSASRCGRQSRNCSTWPRRSAAAGLGWACSPDRTPDRACRS